MHDDAWEQKCWWLTKSWRTSTNQTSPSTSAIEMVWSSHGGLWQCLIWIFLACLTKLDHPNWLQTDVFHQVSVRGVAISTSTLCSQDLDTNHGESIRGIHEGIKGYQREQGNPLSRASPVKISQSTTLSRNNFLHNFCLPPQHPSTIPQPSPTILNHLGPSLCCPGFRVVLHQVAVSTTINCEWQEIVVMHSADCTAVGTRLHTIHLSRYRHWTSDHLNPFDRTWWSKLSEQLECKVHQNASSSTFITIQLVTHDVDTAAWWQCGWFGDQSFWISQYKAPAVLQCCSGSKMVWWIAKADEQGGRPNILQSWHGQWHADTSFLYWSVLLRGTYKEILLHSYQYMPCYYI